ncbi:hypothetical protein F511_35314 [Dorcoceras hygrometricum]|uniref:Uncharacterized protein n=1 Tax=Dorcoceras hygrometricum TaxID=472368 RepID=A0A2Z7CL83_9LAMI|nr:hypothetical protein F511_35314 [Dorcoceras hygrometricum]
MQRVTPTSPYRCKHQQVATVPLTSVDFTRFRYFSLPLLALRLMNQQEPYSLPARDFATVACCWYCARASDWMTSVVRYRFDQLQRCVSMLRLVQAERGVMRCFVLATGYPAAGSEDCVSYATSFEHQFPYLEYFPAFRSLFLRTLEHCSAVSFSGEFPSFPVVVLLVRVAHYHTVNTPRGHGCCRSLELYLSSLPPLLVEPSVVIRCLMHSICIYLMHSFSFIRCSPYWGLTPCPSGAWFVSLFVLFSGNPGFTAGRGFNPAGGAPGAFQISAELVPSAFYLVVRGGFGSAGVNPSPTVMISIGVSGIGQRLLCTAAVLARLQGVNSREDSYERSQRGFRADAKILFSLCCKITWSEAPVTSTWDEIEK